MSTITVQPVTDKKGVLEFVRCPFKL